MQTMGWRQQLLSVLAPYQRRDWTSCLLIGPRNWICLGRSCRTCSSVNARIDATLNDLKVLRFIDRKALAGSELICSGDSRRTWLELRVRTCAELMTAKAAGGNWARALGVSLPICAGAREATNFWAAASGVCDEAAELLLGVPAGAATGTTDGDAAGNSCSGTEPPEPPPLPPPEPPPDSAGVNLPTLTEETEYDSGVAVSERPEESAKLKVVRFPNSTTPEDLDWLTANNSLHEFENVALLAFQQLAAVTPGRLKTFVNAACGMKALR